MPPRRRVPSRKMKDGSSSTRPTRFFIRIITSTVLSQGKLDLHDEFVSRFGLELATVASVTVPSGDVWEVGLERTGNRISFAENLKEFMEFYGIHDLYLLMFTYTGDSKFSVVICDSAGAEILYRLRENPPTPSVSVESISVTPISSSSDEEEIESVSCSVFEVHTRREMRRNKGKKKIRGKATVPRTSKK